MKIRAIFTFFKEHNKYWCDNLWLIDKNEIFILTIYLKKIGQIVYSLDSHQNC